MFWICFYRQRTFKKPLNKQNKWCNRISSNFTIPRKSLKKNYSFVRTYLFVPLVNAYLLGFHFDQYIQWGNFNIDFIRTKMLLQVDSYKAETESRLVTPMAMDFFVRELNCELLYNWNMLLTGDCSNLFLNSKHHNPCLQF